MKLEASPENTVAVLVGIESYPSGDGWNVEGPATSALRMAEWLLEQGVPGKNIRLLLNQISYRSAQAESLREGLLALLAKHEIEVQAPTRTAIEAALTLEALPAISGAQGNLIVYFCGHGLGSPITGKRFAVAADATPVSFAAIDLDFQAKKLRLHGLKHRFAWQWIIQDACAQHTSSKVLPLAVSSELPHLQQWARQYCLYATRPGEFAATGPEHGAAFTHDLLALLGDCPHLQGLDLDGIFEAIEQRFQGSAQHPTLTRIDEFMSEVTLTEQSTSVRTPAGNALAEAIGGLPISAALLDAVYSDVMGDEARAPANIRDLFRSLESRAIMAGNGLRGIELFAIRLESFCMRHAKASATSRMDRKAYAGAAKVLASWIDAEVGKTNAPAVMRERRRLQELAAMAQRSPRIVLELAGAPGSCDARAWHFGESKLLDGCVIPLSSTRLEDQLAEALGRLAEKEWLFSEVVIELVLPLKQAIAYFEGVEVTVDAQSGVSYKLGGRQLLLVVRIAERWNSPVWIERWKSHWAMTADARKGRPNVCWLRSNTPHSEGWAWLGATDIANGDVVKALEAKLYEGMAFAIWCEGELGAALERSLTKHTYADILSLLQELSAFQEDGCRLTCLVDDADRVPPGAGRINNRLIQPSLRG